MCRMCTGQKQKTISWWECATPDSPALKCAEREQRRDHKILTKLCKCRERNYCINLHKIRLTHNNECVSLFLTLSFSPVSLHIAVCTIQFFSLFSRKTKKNVQHTHWTNIMIYVNQLWFCRSQLFLFSVHFSINCIESTWIGMHKRNH